MPLQKPISCSISRSYSVRMRSRWASRSLFCDSRTLIRSSSSTRIVCNARFNLSAGVTNCLAGKNVITLSDSRACPGRGSNPLMASISSLQQRAGCGQPQALDLFVNRRILLNVSVGARDVSFGLIVIEIADEIFDRVFREELLELGVKLGRECFVVRNHQRRPVQLPNYIGDHECFARTGHAEQRLVSIACLNRFNELGDGLPLVAARFIVGFEL